jgi:hypothetical protein
VSWVPIGTQITNYNHYQARTCLAPGAVAIGSTGLFNLSWSHPNRIPTWLRNDGSTFLFGNWLYYGGERAVHGHALASAFGGTMLWCWVDEEDNGSLRVVRSTDVGASWGWASAPAAASHAQPGLAVATVNGVRTWVLVWAHLDRADHANTGYLRCSVSTNDGASWTAPQVLDTFYKSLSGVAVAASPGNRVMVGFAWAPNGTYGINAVRTFECIVSGGTLVRQRTCYSTEASRVQPALSYDPVRQWFIMAYREQNFLTSIRTTAKAWNTSNWPAAAQVQGTTAATAPTLATAPNGTTVLWYGGE